MHFTRYATRAGIVGALAASTVLLMAAGRSSQQQSQGFDCHFEKPDSLWRHPVMVAAIRDGQVVFQDETELSSNGRLYGDAMRPGIYDIRVEGEGVVTEVKRGVQLFPGRQQSLYFNIRPGRGLHVVEYTTGALPREEIAARLARLEAAVAELRKQHATQ